MSETVETTPTTAPAASVVEAKPAAPPAVPPKVEEPAKAPPKADAWAKLGQKERHLSTREAEIKKREEALAAKEGELTTKGSASEKERIKGLVAAGRYDEAAEELGLTYQQWTKAKLRAKGDKPNASVETVSKDAIAKLVSEGVEKTLSDREAASAKAREERVAAHWEATMTNVTSLVKSGGEKYEMIAAEMDLRPGLIEDTLRAMDELDIERKLTVEVALSKIEEYLLTRTGNLIRSSKKLAALRDGSTTAPATGQSPKQVEQSTPREQSGQAIEGGPRTLTNVLAADGASKAPLALPTGKGARIAIQRREEEERIRRIAAKL